jgi:hypothetical protein
VRIIMVTLLITGYTTILQLMEQGGLLFFKLKVNYNEAWLVNQRVLC